MPSSCGTAARSWRTATRTGRYPDCWDLVGGHVEPGETPEQAVVRECREEVGVEIADPTPFAMAFDDPTLEVHPFVVTRWAMLPGIRRAVQQAAPH